MNTKIVDPKDHGSLRSVFGTRSSSITPDELEETVESLRESRRQLEEVRNILALIRKREDIKWKLLKVNRDKYVLLVGYFGE